MWLYSFGCFSQCERALQHVLKISSSVEEHMHVAECAAHVIEVPACLPDCLRS
jgi:hypothetical protein